MQDKLKKAGTRILKYLSMFSTWYQKLNENLPANRDNSQRNFKP
jgi:hypothetical protein